MSTIAEPSPIDLLLSSLMQSLYNLKPGGSGDGPFTKVLREQTDYGVNVGILVRETDIILAFRGSVTLLDWLRDGISFIPESIPGVGTVPVGFAQGLLDCLKELQQHYLTGKPVRIVGHSLGAAHAAIISQMLTRSGITPGRTVLMGCPDLILFSDRKDLIEAGPVINYRNGKDFVTDVPPDPWEQMVVPFFQINGGHDTIPGPFMWHHIDYYCRGISLALRRAA